MNGLSLFSGIGGIDLALAPWVRPVAYCEIDPYAQAVLLSRMADGSLPCAPIWPDVRTLPWCELPPVEIVYGGFPCQDLSLAGRGAGLGGKRSGLFFEMLRIVAEIRPAFVFLENVPALTARGLDQVTAELSALRFDCRWGVLSANDMGAPHLRERIWILAHANGLGLGDEPESQSRRKRKTQSRNDGPQEPVAYAPGLRRREGEPVSGQAEREVLAHADWRGEALAHAQGTRLPRRRGGQRDETQDTGPERRSPLGDSDGERAQGNGLQSPGQADPFTEGPGWWATEPDVGRVAHGVPDRVDRLRGLGNAVVPQAAREAFMRLAGLTEPKGT